MLALMVVRDIFVNDYIISQLSVIAVNRLLILGISNCSFVIDDWVSDQSLWTVHKSIATMIVKHFDRAVFAART